MELNFKSYEELEKYLEEWTTYSRNKRMYDAIGMAALLNACIQNLMVNKNQYEVDEISGIITEENLNFIKTFDVTNSD
jgi:hypothetical protein